MAVFQWLQVASSLGNEEADGMADDLYEAALSRGGDETVAVLHYEVAEWFINGDNGVAANTDLGLWTLASTSWSARRRRACHAACADRRPCHHGPSKAQFGA